MDRSNQISKEPATCKQECLMNHLINLFEEFVTKAIVETERALNLEASDIVSIENFMLNRDRLLQIINQISNQIEWETVSDEKKSTLNRYIDYIKKLDEKLLVKLQSVREEIKGDIEKTFKQKENIKGYNLNDTK
jgi:hypothetical protein